MCVKNIPTFLKGALRNALRIAIDVANSSDEFVAQRGVEVVHVVSEDALPSREWFDLQSEVRASFSSHCQG